MSHLIEGRCHCGNLSFEITTDIAAADIVARACDCSFCRRHGTRNWSDANGSAKVRVKDSQQLQKYQFGLSAADFFICTTCGTYAGAVLADDDGTWATLNLRLTDLYDVPEQAASYGTEGWAARVARRKALWTPTQIEIDV